jgi:hypothetical protein
MVDLIGGLLALVAVGLLFANIDAISEKQVKSITILGWVITIFIIKGKIFE